MGTASSYGVLAQSAVTSATPSGITGTAGSEIGVGGATAPTGSISPSGAVTLGGASISALTSAATALADNHSGVVVLLYADFPPQLLMRPSGTTADR